MLDPLAPNGFSGYCVDLLDELARALHFEYNITLSPNGRIGNLHPDTGTWDGIVAQLLDRRADIGLAAMSVMAERETVIDFTVPFYDLVGIAIMMKVPHTDADYFRFLSVLETDVWLCVLASFGLTSVALCWADRLSPFSWQNQRELMTEAQRGEVDVAQRRVFDLKESMWFCLMSLTPQGGGSVPRSWSAQCVAATWWLYG